MSTAPFCWRLIHLPLLRRLIDPTLRALALDSSTYACDICPIRPIAAAFMGCNSDAACIVSRRYAQYDKDHRFTGLVVPPRVCAGVRFICGRFNLDYDVVMREIKQVHKAAKRLDREGGLSRSQLRLAQQNLLCFVSDLWLGSDGYQIAEARVAAAHAAAQAADGVNGAALKARADALATNLKAREDGPDQDYASFSVFKDYAMASFTVLISSAVVEGFFSQFAGMKDKTRNLMADQTWSWSMWTRMAVPINSEAAEGFDLEPKLKDDARKDRLDWTYK